MISTPDQRIRVFISSTLKELENERKAARDAIERLRLTPVLFELGARPYAARELYKSYLMQSHIFIGIYWQSYGWVPEGSQMSGLEDEYRLSQGMPRLIYIKTSSGGKRDERLEAMLVRMKRDDVSYRYFSDPDELRETIQDDLIVLLSERFGYRTHRYIPVPKCRLIGRESDLDTALDYIRSGIRIITITGIGGVGKTRLAIEVALKSPVEPCWVSLDAVKDDKEVIDTIARSLGVKAGQDEIIERFGDRENLLVLDCFEHVIGASAIISEMMASCPRLRCLITSRVPLRIYGEHEICLRPLPTADRSIELFVEVAKTFSPDFDLNKENSETVRRIVEKLDGLPLAIELAASRTNAYEPKDILLKLGSATELSNAQRDAPKRHKTLFDTFDWSYGLLDPKTRSLFLKLSEFPGNFTLEDAEKISDDAFDSLQTLVDNSLIIKEGDHYQILGLVRQYANRMMSENTGEAV
jgi:predicted ATPase